MNILLFGASGTAGNAVLQACLSANLVHEVRAIVRKPLHQQNVKLRTFVHTNYLDYSAVRVAFSGMDACLFCLGTSVTQVTREDFVKISHDYPLAAAKLLKEEAPNAIFHYISGAGTRADSKTFWSKTKGQTENELMELVGADCWRPAFIDAKPSSTLPRTFALFWPVFRLLKPFPSLYVRGEDLGRAMLQATSENMRGRVIENKEIRQIAGRFGA